MNAVEILNLKGLPYDVSQYVVLQTYKGCGVDALKAGQSWLFSLDAFYPLKDPYQTWNYAASNGHLDVVKWLHEYTKEGCTHLAMDRASENGHLEVVKWLHEHRSEGCTGAAMDRAASNGHLEVVKWLHEHRSEGCTHLAMDYAASNGHLEIVILLHHNGVKFSDRMFVTTVRNGHLHVVKWLYQNISKHWHDANSAIDIAISNGHFKMVKWLMEHMHRCPSIDVMNAAALSGYHDIIQWLNNTYGYNCNVKLDSKK